MYIIKHGIPNLPASAVRNPSRTTPYFYTTNSVIVAIFNGFIDYPYIN